MIKISKKNYNGSLANMTKQFRANPALVDILAFRADEFAKTGHYKEAIAGIQCDEIAINDRLYIRIKSLFWV